MKTAIAKSDWLTALACPAMAWHGLRTDAAPPTEAERFRMQQGQEIGALARKLYADGFMIPPAKGSTAAEETQQYFADESKTTFFEATLSAGPLVAKADIIRRQDRAWHVLEVKSRFSDDAASQDLIEDLAYTVMVFRRAGLAISRASLVLLSRDFRYGDAPERLFEIADVTAEVMPRVASLDGEAEKYVQELFSDEPPTPVLVPACRDCTFFDDMCLGAGFAHRGLAIRDGDTAITRFARMARGEVAGEDIEATRRQLLDYCRLDTFAMVRLHDALQGLAPRSATAPNGFSNGE